MAFRLVSSAGEVADPAFVLLYASGVVAPGQPVDWTRQATNGEVVGPSATATHSTAIFGVCLDYAQGASDTLVRVIPFTLAQLWEVDCANAATTAQLGIRHALSATRGYIHNTATDQGGVDVRADRMDAVFHAFYMVGSTSGSGKLVGRFLANQYPVDEASHI